MFKNTLPGGIEFTYENEVTNPIQPDNWFVTYENCTIMKTGFKVDMIQVEYDFTNQTNCTPVTKIYYCSFDGVQVPVTGQDLGLLVSV